MYACHAVRCVLISLLWLHWLQCIWRAHCPPVTTRHPSGIISAVQTLVTGPQLPPRDVRVLCRYFIPHFTSSDFTMHKQSKFRERSLVRSCTASASDPAGHTCPVLLHSCEHLTFGYFPMSHFLTINHQWLTQKSPVRVSGHDFNL